MTVQRIAQLRAKRTAANPASQTAEDGTRYITKRDAERSSDSANQRTCLAAGQRSADTTRNTAYGADGRADFHGLME